MTIKYMKSIVLPLVLVGLVACGSEGQKPELTDQLIGSLKTTMNQRKTSKTPQAAALLTRAQVEQSTVPLLRLTVGKTNSQATAAELARNGDTATYLMGTGQAVYIRGGLLTGTRGLGYDLMSLEMPFRSINAAVGKGAYQRVHRYLNSEGKLVKRSFSCSAQLMGVGTLKQLDRSYAVRMVVENCLNDTVKFQNNYDLDRASGKVWRSRQWVGPLAGYSLIEQLKS
jgi:hypothetical protein